MLKQALIVLALLCLVGTAAAADKLDPAAVQAAIKAAGLEWIAGPNAISNLSPEQFAAIATGLDLDELARSQVPLWEPPDVKDDLPLIFDWRSNPGDFTTAPKNQGNCGACGAFAACSLVESLIEISMNDPNVSPDLSEAHLFFCGNGACMTGSTAEMMLGYAREYGIPDEACLPYTAGEMGQNQSCAASCADWQSRALAIIESKRVSSDPNMIMQALNEGPLFAGMIIYLDFQFYGGDVYEHATGPSIGSHAVEMIGYNAQEQYWICKNSWSPGWGEGGYFRIRWGQAEIENWLYKSEYLNGIPCSLNGGPLLGPARYFVGDQELGDNPTIGRDEDFEVRIDFSDAECNIAGGDIWMDEGQGDGWKRLDRLPADAGCSSAEYGPIVYSPDELEPGDYSVLIRGQDRCDEQGQSIEIKFSVTEDAPDRSDDDDAVDDDDDDDDDSFCGS